jgi:hypothetical protein
VLLKFTFASPSLRQAHLMFRFRESEIQKSNLITVP